MKTGPDIARIGSLVGDPARANILTALMAGRALTVSELAQEAGVTMPTTSSHLAKMQEAGLVRVQKQGRHRYYRLGGDDIAHLLETLMGIAERTGQVRVRTGPREPALRKARVCYDHLAGELGVRLYDSLRGQGYIEDANGAPLLTDRGREFCAGFGIALPALERLRRPVCRDCLDWSVRRSHLAGSLGAGLLTRFYELGWAKRESGTRVVAFSAPGEQSFLKHFTV